MTRTQKFASRSLAALVATLAVGALVASPAAGQAAKALRPFEKLQYPALNEIRSPAVTRESLSNGVTLLLVEDHELPTISFRAVIRGGTIAEPRGKTGLTELFSMAHRTGGTRSMTGDQLDEFLERIGASVEASVSQAYATVGGNTLVEHVDKVLPVLVEVLTAPAFSQDKIDLAKTQLRGVIARRNDNVNGIGMREFNKLIYGKDSPYARQIEYDDLDGLSREDLLAFHARTFRPDQTILAVWGDFDTAQMKQKIESLLAGWSSSGPAPTYKTPTVPAPAASVNYIEKKDLEQSYIFVGHASLRLDDPDYPAVLVMNNVLGSGMSSRIFKRVRTEKGLAYSARGAIMPAYDHSGALYAMASTKPGSTAEALGTIIGEIKAIREGLPTDAEMKLAKDGYLNSYAFQFDSTAKVVNRLQEYLFYGYPQDFNKTLRDKVEKVTKEDVQRVAQKHLHPEALAILAIGKADAFDKPLSTFGTVNTVDITIPEPKPKEVIPEATPESLKAGTELLTKVAKATGESALRGLKDLAVEASMTSKTPMGEMEVKTKSTVVLPDRLYVEATTPMGAMVQVLDKDAAWMKMGPQTRDLPASRIAELKRGLLTDNGCLLMLKQVLEGTLQGQLIGQAKLEGKDAIDVLVKVGETPLRVYVAPDGQTILGVKQRTMTQEGPADALKLFSTYTAAGGLKLPFDTVQKVKDEVRATIKVSAVRPNAGADPAIFTKPSGGQ